MGRISSINMPSLLAVSLRKDTSFLNDVGANHFFLPLAPSKGDILAFPLWRGLGGGRSRINLTTSPSVISNAKGL
jgi:hypothetical protein